jgi:ABC-2 type transport system permease protein
MNRLREFLSNVLAIAYKEASVLRHDKALMGAVLAQPVMMFLLMGVALSNKPANVPWVILDRDGSAAARRLVEEVMATGTFLPPERVTGYEGGEALLERGKALAMLVIPQDFRRGFERSGAEVQVLVDGSDPLQAARVGGYLTQIASGFDPARRPPPSRGTDDRVRSLGPLDLRQRFWFNPTLSDREFFLAALAGMLLTNLCLSATSLGLVAERESGTYEQTLALPTTPIQIVLGKLVPYVGICYLILLFATIAPGVVFGLWPEGSYVTLFIVTLPFVLASLSVGVLVSALARTSAQAVFISVFFILPSFVLSGAMFPYQFMPDGVRQLGGLFPLRWYQIALRRIIERGGDLGDVAVPTLVLCVLFLVVLAMIRWRMNPRLG